jgi:hypothetical protein
MHWWHSCDLNDAGTYIIGPRLRPPALAYTVGGINSGRHRTHLRGSIYCGKKETKICLSLLRGSVQIIVMAIGEKKKKESNVTKEEGGQSKEYAARAGKLELRGATWLYEGTEVARGNVTTGKPEWRERQCDNQGAGVAREAV